MISRTSLDVTRLSAAAQRALGPGPGRAMAARGLVPLPSADQVAVLYQLALDPDPGLAGAARATAAGLPERLLAGTLADPGIDPRVLDLFAELAAGRAAVFDAIVLNPAVADETIATLAAKGDAREVDLIAQNEQRVLRYPAIIAAMYMNRRARMSTIDRVVELAVRNNVRVPGLAAWDEVARALTGGSRAGEQDDTLIQGVLAAAGDDSALLVGDAERAPPEEAPPGRPVAAAAGDADDPTFEKMSIPAKIRLASIGNASIRAKAVRSPHRIVALAAIKAQGVKDMEVVNYACNRNLLEDVIRYIASKREWTKLYGVKVALCRNPKTPLVEATRMLTTLRERDLQELAKSKGVPSALAAQARRLVLQRRTGTGKP
ncbi:MAG TPA: hypothetical protein VNO30_16355 [Kofleriaceae bacterium]|nr:hypothetical protein [Kofleriaceae bacterium]